MKYKLLIFIVFLIGWFSHSLYAETSIIKQNPLSLFNTTELTSPSDHIEESQIHVYKDRVVIELNKPYWSKFSNTNSMDPLLDEFSNGIEIKPNSIDQVSIGDIISYKLGNNIIIHRVINTGFDAKGWYAVTKGDNNAIQDLEKVRFNQIEGILVGILY
ncbi:MAG: hypothetical protein KKG75_00485 [Nanoarchaeota archaeon]|nr:hypothetical protein [Nanoarchaeota archaeon]